MSLENTRLRMARTMLSLFLLSSVMSPQVVFAHARNYVWTEEYKTIPQGVFEIENWVTFKVPDGGRTNKNTIQYQEELEYGLTDRWTLAHYQRWKTKNQVGRDDSTIYEGFKFETKYRMGEKGQYWIDPLFYLEWVTDVRAQHRNNKIEGKIVLSKDIEKLNVTHNQILESELDRGGRTEHQFRVAASYEVFSEVRLGCELQGDYWKPGSHRNRISIGPTVSYENPYFWVAGGLAFGVNNAADDFQARILVGIPF